MKKIRTMLLLCLSVFMMGASTATFNANESVSLKEVFPNDALRMSVANLIGESEDAIVSESQLLEIKDIDLNSSVQISSLEELAPLKNLEDIMLRWQYNITNLTGVENLPNLNSLFAVYTGIGTLEGLETATNLETLIIRQASNAFAEHGADVLLPIKDLQLKRLELQNAGLTDEKMTPLSGMTSLEVLNVSSFEEKDRDVPEQDWVISTDSLLANKLTNLDFLKDLPNLNEVSAVDNNIRNVDGLAGHKEKLKVLNLNTPNFGKPFSETNAVTDLSNIYVSDNYQNMGITFSPMLTNYVTKEVQLDLENDEFYVDLSDLKPFHIYNEDGGVGTGTVKVDERSIPITLTETSTGYRASWNMHDGINQYKNGGWQRLFEIDMFDKDQRHATFIYSISTPSTEVVVKYVDEDANELVESDVFNNKHQLGENYSFLAKEIANYEVKEIPSNAIGILIENKLELVFVYQRKNAGDVFINHVDKKGEQLLEERCIIGKNKLGQHYVSVEKEIPNYELVEIPENAEGEFKEEDQYVTYVYDKNNSDTPATVLPGKEEPIGIPNKETTVDTDKSESTNILPKTGITYQKEMFAIMLLLAGVVLIKIYR